MNSPHHLSVMLTLTFIQIALLLTCVEICLQIVKMHTVCHFTQLAPVQCQDFYKGRYIDLEDGDLSMPDYIGAVADIDNKIFVNPEAQP
jgi:hypothetical protein